MAETKPDRRIQRTRQMLNNALIELILERGYEAVTVQDILDRGNIGRSTFYLHYRDKEELLLSSFEQVAQAFRQHFPENPADVQPEQDMHYLTLSIFQHAQSHRPLFKAMFGKQGGDVVVRSLHKILLELAAGQIQAAARRGKSFNVPPDILAHWLVSSFMALLTWWLDEDIPQTPEEMDAVFWRLTLPGIQSVMETR